MMSSSSNELIDVVNELNKSCPWTLSVSSKKMLKYVEEEIREIREEMDSPTQKSSTKKDEAAPLESELGDLLFNQLKSQFYSPRHRASKMTLENR